MLDELKQNLTEASFNKDVQVIILSASGPVFSAGHNLKELVSCNIVVAYHWKQVISLFPQLGIKAHT